MATYITVADMRDEMLDRVAADHLVLPDLAFTDSDIEWAMKACARKFNSLSPMVMTVTWDKLPFDTSVFADGVAWALLRRWHRNVSMNDYDYSADGVNANVQGSLLRNLEKLQDKLEAEFVESSIALKLHLNLESAYGQIG